VQEDGEEVNRDKDRAAGASFAAEVAIVGDNKAFLAKTLQAVLAPGLLHLVGRGLEMREEFLRQFRRQQKIFDTGHNGCAGPRGRDAEDAYHKTHRVGRAGHWFVDLGSKRWGAFSFESWLT